MNDPTETPTLAWIAPDDDDPRYQGELDLRYRVLRLPLGMGRETVRFPFERDALHLVALGAPRADEPAVVGCVLFHREDATQGRLLQMAVDPTLQGRGVGLLLVRALEQRVGDAGVRRIHLHARDTAIGFYERLGYRVFGAPYLEVGIGHHHMARWLGGAG